MKKRITSLLLTLAMLLSLVPALGVTASAAEEGDWTEVGTYEELYNAFRTGKSKIRLKNNINTGSMHDGAGLLPAEVLDIPKDKDITLDLNGKTLTLKSDHAYIYCLIKVQAGGSLTIQSTGERGTLNSIYVGSSRFTNASIMVGKGGNLTVDNVTIAADDPLNWQSLIRSELGNVSIRNAELVTTERTSSDTIGGKYCLDAQLGNEGEDGQVTITDSKLVGVLQLDYEAVDASTRQTRATLTNVTMDGDIDILGNRDPSRPWYYPIQINSGTVSGDICLDYHYRYTDFQNDGFGESYENHETQAAFDAQIDGAIQTLFGPNSVVVNARGKIFTAMNAGEQYTWYRYHPSNSVGTVQKSDPWCPVITSPKTIYTPDQFMKEVTLDDEKIEWGKDWKSEVHYLDNGKDHNLTFTWDPLPEALTKAGVTYDAYLKYQKPGSSEWYNQACRPGNDYITFTLPKDYPTGFYGFDLILNLEDKEGKLLGASFNEHIVRILLKDAPEEPVVTELNAALVKLSGVVTPGDSAPTVAEVSSGCTVESISWFTDKECTTPADTFVEGTSYYVKIALRAAANYKFANTATAVAYCDDPNDNYGYRASNIVSADGSTLTFVMKGTAIAPFRWKSVDTADTSYTIGDSALTFRAKATGGDTETSITYKLVAEKDGAQTVMASGTASDEFSARVRFTETGSYRCWFEAKRGDVTITSTPFTVTVNAPGLNLTNQSGDFTIMEGEHARLFVIVKSSAGGVSYQWQVKEGGNWTDLDGETRYDCRIVPTEPGTKVYRCQITNSYGTAMTSREMTVTALEDTTEGRTPFILLPGINGDTPDPEKLWPEKVLSGAEWFSLKAEYHVTAGETFTGTATFSTLPEGYAVYNPDNKVYRDEDGNALTPVLGTVTYEWRGTEKNYWEAGSGDFISLGTDEAATFTIPNDVDTYYVELKVTNTIGEGSTEKRNISNLVITFHVDPAHEHTYAYAQLDDTQHTKYCVDCSFSTKENHTMESGACTLCGYAPAQDYSITVNGGTASPASAVPGTTITLTPNAAPAGQKFDKWAGNVTVTGNTFTMPGYHVTVSATYKAKTCTHTYSHWTYMDPGGHYQTCDLCGDFNYEDHTFGSWAKVDENTHSRTCSKCKMSGGSAYTETANHNWKWVVDTEPTLTQKGTQHEECADCSAKRNEGTAIPKLESIQVQNLTVLTPVKGEAPVMAGTTDATYYVAATEWLDQAGNPVGDTFQSNTVYSAKITLEAMGGGVFSANSTYNAIGGKNPVVSPTLTGNAYAETVVLIYTFDKTGSDSSTGGGTTGGGGGGGVTTYAITVKDAKSGDVTASHKSAAKGTTVTLTVKPDKGYELDTLTVLDSKNQTVKLTPKDGKFTFIMPGSKVTVEATFKAEAPVIDHPFTDIPEGSWYEDAVIWAVDKGITGGTSATTFSPNGICTRAQAVTFLWRAAGSPEPKTSTMPFTDVKADSYYYDAVLWAVEQGITAGTSATTFAPDLNCSRAQIVTFLWRAAGSPAVSGSPAFSDVASDAYYAKAVKWAQANGITSGIGGGLFGSNDNCTRAQIVTFIWRALAE